MTHGNDMSMKRVGDGSEGVGWRLDAFLIGKLAMRAESGWVVESGGRGRGWGWRLGKGQNNPVINTRPVLSLGHQKRSSRERLRYIPDPPRLERYANERERV